LAEIEASTVLAKKSDIPEGITVEDIEASTVLAKETTVESRLAAADYVAPDNDKIEEIRKTARNRVRLNRATNRIEVYEDNKETVAFSFAGFDEAGNPTIDSVFDRIPV
jgi:hypothetical protein